MYLSRHPSVRGDSYVNVDVLRRAAELHNMFGESSEFPGLASSARGTQLSAMPAATAQWDMARLYELGDGPVQQDDTEALKWFEAAARRGHTLGAGRAPVGDAATAREAWLGLFPSSSLPRAAAIKASDIYLAGRGVPVDELSALHWLVVAAKLHQKLGGWVRAPRVALLRC